MPANYSLADRLQTLMVRIFKYLDPEIDFIDDLMSIEDLFPEIISFDGILIDQEEIATKIKNFDDSFGAGEMHLINSTQISGDERISQRARVKRSWLTRFMGMEPRYEGIEVEFNVEVMVAWENCRIVSVNCAVDKTNLVAASRARGPRPGGDSNIGPSDRRSSSDYESQEEDSWVGGTDWTSGWE